MLVYQRVISINSGLSLPLAPPPPSFHVAQRPGARHGPGGQVGGHGPGHRRARRGGVEAEEHHGAHGEAPQRAGLGKSIVIIIIYIIFMVLFI